jgi:MFS family permease
MGDVRLAMMAQTLCILGASVRGFFTPSFAVMALFVFINSMGMHLYIPLQDSIGMSIIGKQDLGKRMGQYSAIRTGFMMFASILIFIGFRVGFFSFKTPIKLPFIIGAAGFAGIFVLFILLYTKFKVYGESRKKHFQIIIKKEYSLYYALAILIGVHRQIMIVFGPWVLIDIMSRQADTLALLGIISSFIGIFLLPAIGRWMDRFGTRIILLVEGYLFIAVYLGYGLISKAFLDGTLAMTGIPVFIVYVMFIADRLAMNTGIVRTVYLKSIVTDPADITPTISTGLSMDHVVSIVLAYIGGVVWFRYGPQYVFYTAAVISIFNVIIALKMKPGVHTALEK